MLGVERMRPNRAVLVREFHRGPDVLHREARLGRGVHDVPELRRAVIQFVGGKKTHRQKRRAVIPQYTFL